MEYRGTSLPSQKVSMKEKDEDWKHRSLDAILARNKIGGERHQRQLLCYRMMDGDFDLEDLKYVTNPYKVNEGFPAKMQNINIISPKIKLLLGEESKRPTSYIVFRTGEAAAQNVVDKQKNLLLEAFTADLLADRDPSTSDEELQQNLQEAQSYIKSKYYSPEERAADNTLRYLRAKLRLDDNFLRGFEDGLTGDDEVHYVGIRNGEPYSEKVNPLALSYDYNPDMPGIQYCGWVVRQLQLTASEIHDDYSDKMDDDKFDEILTYINEGMSSVNGTGATINTDYIKWRDVSGMASNNLNQAERRDYTATVYHGVWRSYKKIGYLTFTDENGEDQRTIVDETYKPDADETIEWDWIDEIWEGYRVGKDIYFGIEPIQYQDYSIEEPKDLMLPYVGGRYSGDNSSGKSLVEIMKPLQYFYLILFYRLELTLARDRGKILNMDITQIPASMGIDEYKWMHYLTSHGINFINPYEEGWDIPGRQGGQAAAFNQISEVDLSMSKVIAEYISLMNKVEEMIGELSGISEQRQGAINTHELVGNVERSVIQSSHITEPLFWRHNKIKNDVLRLLLDVAKFAWRRSNRKYINFVLDGPERLFIELNDDFLYSDFDIFVSDSTEEKQNLEALRTLYQPAMQNGASLLDIATIMSTNSLSEIKTQLEKIEKQKDQMIQAQQEADMAIAQQDQSNKEEELRIKEEDSIRKAQTQLQIAMLSKDEDTEHIEGNSLDVEKLRLQAEKQQNEKDIKERQLRETERANRAKESIARSKPKPANTKK